MDKSLDELILASKIKPRNAFIALFFSLLLTGLGQIYNGQPKKGLLFFGQYVFVYLIYVLTNIGTYFYGLIFLLLLEIFLRIYIIVDAVINAKRQKEYVLKSYNKWYYYLLIAIVMFTFLYIFGINSGYGIQTFKFYSHSNNPTFKVGDRLVADMKTYKNNEIDYGDIVIFNSPLGQIWSFRVVGLPNDRLEINDNIVTINGVKSKEIFVGKTINAGVPVYEFIEELPNGHRHRIYKNIQPYDSTKTTIYGIVVDKPLELVPLIPE